ncbi:MAG TPA: hypothetical protein VMV70_01010 [Gallionella sp.]|nr:hypothetical protein [Gallionella sp.]
MITPTRIIFLLPLLLVACGGKFPLYGAVDAPHGTTASQQQSDISYCKSQAQDQASNNGEQTKAFLYGSAALKKDENLQRNIFSSCMTAKGYTVIPVQVVKAAGAPQQTKPAQAKPT